MARTSTPTWARWASWADCWGKKKSLRRVRRCRSFSLPGRIPLHPEGLFPGRGNGRQTLWLIRVPVLSHHSAHGSPLSLHFTAPKTQRGRNESLHESLWRLEEPLSGRRQEGPVCLFRRL